MEPAVAAADSRAVAWLRRADRSAGGLAGDAVVYLGCLLFAALTAATSSLPPHVVWGRYAVAGYAGAALVVLIQLTVHQLTVRRFAGPPVRRHPSAVDRLTGPAARLVVVGFAWLATSILPLVAEALARAGGHRDRAQDEVPVVERAAQRLIDTGTPYLSRAAIAAHPAGQRLLDYTPYQPAMAWFGLPRALGPVAWYTDARVWFAAVTAASIAGALLLLRRGGAGGSPLVRAAQAATVLPLSALELAAGGDDLPVLGLCLLALALAARQRHGAAGVAVGVAGALKLFAWPVAAVLIALAATRGRATALRGAVPACGLPLLVLVPPLLIDPGAVGENLVRFPLGNGLVGTPAASPLPGHLLAAVSPVAAAGLLLLAGAVIGWRLLRHPPRQASAAAAICAWSLLALALLLPSTRFGYLLYPVAYAAWIPALATGARRAPGARDTAIRPGSH